MANIIIPCCGMGSRFVQVGYSIPKPFIPVRGKTMVEHVIDNISTSDDKVYLITKLEYTNYLSQTNLLSKNNISFIFVNAPTEGAAYTVLKSKQFINNSEPLIIANSDQYVVYDKEKWKEVQDEDASIMIFNSNHPKWSYVELNESGNICRVAEKQVISDLATVGVYFYKKGSYFVEGAEQMISKNIRVNSEFYVCPAFNELTNTLNIKPFIVDKMFGMGTPEDLNENYEFIGV